MPLKKASIDWSSFEKLLPSPLEHILIILNVYKANFAKPINAFLSSSSVFPFFICLNNKAKSLDAANLKMSLYTSMNSST